MANSVEYPFLKPNWYGNKISCVSINEISWSDIIFSSILLKGDNNAKAYNLLALKPFLYKGITLETFNMLRTTPCIIDWLSIYKKGFDNI